MLLLSCMLLFVINNLVWKTCQDKLTVKVSLSNNRVGYNYLL